VIKFRYLGDMVLISSVFRNLRLRFPAAHLAALADTAYLEALRYMPDVDEAIAFPREETRRGPPLRRLRAFAGVARELRRRRFDMVIDLADGTTSRILTRITNAPMRVGYSSGPGHRRNAPYNVLARRLPLDEMHFIDHFLEPLTALGVPAPMREPVLRAKPAELRSVAERLEGRGLQAGEFIAVHPGARVPSRCWPAENYAALVDALALRTGRKVALLGSPAEHALADAVVSSSASHPVNLAGKLSFGELLAVLQFCRLFIGNDSGPTHLAAAAGVPVVALFGLQSPRLWRPLGQGHIVVRPPMPCDPCPYPDICEPPHPHRTLCVRRLGVDEVLDAALRALARERAPAFSL
jgi:heptosyltransferase-3